MCIFRPDGREPGGEVNYKYIQKGSPYSQVYKLPAYKASYFYVKWKLMSEEEQTLWYDKFAEYNKNKGAPPS